MKLAMKVSIPPAFALLALTTLLAAGCGQPTAAELANGDRDGAAKRAEAILGDHPSHGPAASVLLQARARDKSASDPRAIVPAATHATPDFSIGATVFLRQHDDPSWRTMAVDAAAAHPGNDLLTRFAAEAELEPLLTIGDYRKGDPLVRQGDEDMEQFFILDGMLKRVVSNPEGREMILRFAADKEMDTSYAAWRLRTPIPYSIVAVTKVTRKAMASGIRAPIVAHRALSVSL